MVAEWSAVYWMKRKGPEPQYPAVSLETSSTKMSVMASAMRSWETVTQVVALASVRPASLMECSAVCCSDKAVPAIPLPAMALTVPLVAAPKTAASAEPTLSEQRPSRIWHKNAPRTR